MCLEDIDTGFSFSGLHCESFLFFGIVEVVAVLIDMRCQISAVKILGGGALPARAAQNEPKEMVKILFGQGEINFDKLGIEDKHLA